MFTIDLNDPSQLTQENVSKLIGSVTDDRHWQLRVREDGIAYLSDVVGNNQLDGLAFRLETWCASNGHVGFQAAHDKSWVNEVYRDLKQNWPKPKDSLVDH